MSDTILRAYSLLHVKTVDAEQRVITGTATTPETDRVGDIVESTGARFKNPLSMLMFHDSTKPVAEVTFGRATNDGIPFQAKFPDPELIRSQTLRERVLEAWDSVRLKLIRGVSIGFKPMKDGVQMLKDGSGFRYTDFEILELSLVVIPANASATIQTVKSLDHGLAASGTQPAIPAPAGVSASVVHLARKGATAMKKTLTERISAFEAERQAKTARLEAITDAAGEEGRTKDEAEKEEFKTLKAEIDSIDDELKDLRDMEKLQIKQAVPPVGTDPVKASESRGGVQFIKRDLPKGTGFTRYVRAMVAGRGSRSEALQFAKRWEHESPEVVEVLKAAVDAGTTTDSTWAAPLVVYQNMASEFIELLRPATIIGRIDGFRRVPFNISMPRQTSGSTVGWVGQAKPKPVGELAFDTVSLGMAKAAGIVVIAEELARSSQPSAEAVIRADLTAAIAKFLDTQFIDPAVAAVTNVSPAAVTNGASVIDSTGVTAAALRADFASALAVWSAADMSIAGGVVIMTETQAIRLSMIMNAFGQPEFPGLGAAGGTLFGLPVVTSENIPSEGGSPAGKRIVLLKPGEVMMADDGGIVVDVSREASVQMNTTPDDPATASTVNVSFWQNNLVGIKAERFINWLKRRSQAAVIIEGALYTG